MQENAAAPTTGEVAPSTNVEIQAPAAPASTTETPAVTAEQVAQYFKMPPESFQEFERYINSNGGLEKAQSNIRKLLSGRNAGADAANQTRMQAQSQMQAPAQAPAQGGAGEMLSEQPQPEVEGGFTAQEFMVQQYFLNLSQQERYAAIKDEIANGDVLKVMGQFGIRPMIGDQFNNKQVTAFLDMYSKTKPTPAPETPVTPTPTAEFVQIADGKITSMDQAMLVLSQDRAARAAGREGHPLAQQANEFFDGVLNANQNRGRREHKVLESK